MNAEQALTGEAAYRKFCRLCEEHAGERHAHLEPSVVRAVKHKHPDLHAEFESFCDGYRDQRTTWLNARRYRGA